MTSIQSRYAVRATAGLCLAVCSICLAAEASAAFVLGSADARTDWPLQADSDVLLWTSYLPTAAGDGGASHRGVQNNRIQSQTFTVVDKPIAIDSIYLGYRYNAGNGNDTLAPTFRIVEIPNIGGVYDRLTVPVAAGPFSTTLNPANPVHQGYYGLRLDWTGSPLVLQPKAGSQGYAFEIVGPHPTTSPIGVLLRPNQIPNSRAIEMNLSGGISSLDGNPPPDLVMVITGTVVPEPATLLLSAGAILGCLGRRLRRRDPRETM